MNLINSEVKIYIFKKYMFVVHLQQGFSDKIIYNFIDEHIMCIYIEELFF